MVFHKYILQHRYQTLPPCSRELVSMGMRKSEGAEHKAEGSNGKQQGLGLYKEGCGADKQQGRQEEKATLSTPEGLCGGYCK